MSNGIGLYGKLPMKRDFVAVGMPDTLLARWEPWLQRGLADLRAALGDAWREVAMRAPIWRFRFGPAACGVAAAGAFMPSVDGVGRLFPLTICVTAASGHGFAPPQRLNASGWFDAVETVLLDALDEAATYDTVLAAMGRLAPLESGPLSTASGPFRQAGPVRILRAAAADDPAERLTRLLADLERQALPDECCFWTIGGDGFPPTVACCTHWPEPGILTALWSGQFGPAAETETHT